MWFFYVNSLVWNECIFQIWSKYDHKQANYNSLLILHKNNMGILNLQSFEIFSVTIRRITTLHYTIFCFVFWALQNGLERNCKIFMFFGSKMGKTNFYPIKPPVNPRSHSPIMLVRELVQINVSLRYYMKFRQNRILLLKLLC